MIYKSLHTFLKRYLFYTLVKFEQIGPNLVLSTRNFELLDKKPGIFNKKKNSYG